ncbi:MAG TPA: alpha/beta hydrolase [Acidimicrobiales bacterium]|jgi:pimeloyl-ACP methyl ester carboxylesterase
MAEDLFVQTAGSRLAVRDYGGDGPPIVLIHGNYGNLASFDYLGPLLTTGLRVVAYDQRGHGWSETGPMSALEFTKDLATVIDTLDLAPPILYGSSFGTLIGLAYLLDGGAARAFITEDGRLSDFPEVLPTLDPPSQTRRILDPENWNAYLAGFSVAGPAGKATAYRSAVERGDGDTEIVPSAADIFAKESAFARRPVEEAYQSAPGTVLALLARRGADLEARQAEADALGRIVDLDITWFDSGHWASAEMVELVAQRVLEFCVRIS